MRITNHFFAVAIFFSAIFGSGMAAGAVYTINGPTGGDDTSIIQNTINQAVGSGDSEVVLRGGTYQLVSYDASSGAHLVVNGGNNITLRGFPGETVSLIYYNVAARGILVNSTKDLRVDSLIFDWRYHPHGQGSVHSVDTIGKVIWVENDAGYATWENSIFNLPFQTTYLLRSARGGTPPNCTVIPKFTSPSGSWGYMGGYNWFMYDNLDNCPDGVQPGQKVVLNRNSWASVGIHLIHVAGAMLSNLTFYASPGLTTLNEFSESGSIYPEISFVNYNIVYHPTDQSRTITSNADGICSRGIRAGVNVVDSEFYGQADNAIDAHGQAACFVNLSQAGGQWVLEYNGYLEDFRNSDTVEIYNVSENVSRCNISVVGAPYACGSNNCIKTNASSCAGMIPYIVGAAGESNGNVADWITIVDQGVGIVVSGNLFYGSRGLAVLNRTSDAIITGNVIGDPSYGRPNWAGIYEGVCANDIQFGPQGIYTFPGHDNQVVVNNSGVYGNQIIGCWR